MKNQNELLALVIDEGNVRIEDTFWSSLSAMELMERFKGLSRIGAK